MICFERMCEGSTQKWLARNVLRVECFCVQISKFPRTSIGHSHGVKKEKSLMIKILRIVRLKSRQSESQTTE